MHETARQAWSTADRGGVVAVYQVEGSELECEYEIESCMRLARRIAGLKGLEFAGAHQPALRASGPVYLVPTDTLVGTDFAASLGVRDAHDLFGGVAPVSFVATKAITQPLVAAEAAAPAGWSRLFAARAADAVLRGYTVFDADDARIAAQRLFELGPLRLKPVHARGGLGQVVATDMDQVEVALMHLATASLACGGLVLEENLEEVVTCSVGQVRVGGLVASYHGTQRLTTNNFGQEVYGGTRLTVVRGGFDRLLERDLETAERTAIRQARTYEDAALAAYPGLLLSRSNYDVAQGRDGRGRWRSGVLEQSWRLGGATPAELVALEAFAADPALAAVRSECIEIYGEHETPPAGADLLLDMEDPRAGRIRKYTLCEEVRDA
ncbi:DUF3182 family protein [Coralloluteibacterium stylophorae]|uniref:DUF3182 family protein n=1 Tax=Coralloluteibacterium stylophorae TaxID=1776034 RepID=A0A8J8AYV3_9GAMM|nr:DUF3182 family protein [Coralloluteibacterium stylophorae]MBS7455570.1 DUF3182 family protein [Coralloluteibacterium stylophorae]